MRKQKVLQINKMYYPVIGGVEKVVQQIAEGLRTKVDMEVLVCNRKGTGAQKLINGVKVTYASSFGVYFSMPVSVSFLFQLRKMAKEKDILLFHMPFPLGDVAGLLSGYRGKVIVWWHGDIVKQKRLLKLYEPVMKKFLERADKIIVATEGGIIHSKYLKDFREKCVVIPFGVDDLYLNDSAEYKQQKNQQENTNETIFLFVGRLVYSKGCDILLKAFAKLETGKLILAGPGPLRDELMELSKKLGIEDRVSFINEPTEKLRDLYRNCDVFVLPSVTESFGLVQIEAMAYGKPVINTNVKNGAPYVGVHGKTGFTVEPMDVDALYEAMKKLQENAGLRKEMGAFAYELVRKKYKMDDMLKSVFYLFESVVTESEEGIQ